MSVAVEPARRTILSADNPEIPWWAVWLLEFPKGHPAAEVRWRFDYARGTDRLKDASVTREHIEMIWSDMLRRAQVLAGRFNPLDVARSEPDTMRHVALKSQRAFCELTGLMGDDQELLRLMGFHVRVIRMIRGQPLSIALLPAQHGKSALSTMVIPLMDWAEQSESVSIRAYQTQKDFSVPMTRKIMDVVENNQEIKILFPWIRRPERGDPCEKMWSTNGFSIGGKRVVEYSFRPVTPGASTVGIRGDRIIADDWVTEKNCSTAQIQERFYHYFHSGVMTMRRKTEWKSKYGTLWGTAAAVGTIYDRQDYLARLHKEWKALIDKGDPGRRVLRFSVYPGLHARQRGQVLWPYKRPLDWVRGEEAELGRRGFRMRYLNLPMEDDEVVFREQSVKDALSDEWEFGQAPPGSRVIIGYDPGKGAKRGGHSPGAKFPACVVLAFRPDPQNPARVYCHIVEWHRWSVPQPEQIRRLIAISVRYQSSIVVEDNATQRSYSEWIAEIAPEVRVINHTTGAVKHDVNDGVESFQPLFDNGLMIIHTRGAAQADIKALADEWMEWPQGRYTDLVMACWMARYQFKLLDRTSRPTVADDRRPIWQTRIPGSYTVDLSKYR
jgi:hypothetical protein